MKTLIADRKQSCRAAAERFAALCAEYPGAAAALDTAPDLDGIYTELGRLAAEGRFCPEGHRFFAVREISGTSFLAEKLRSNLAAAGIPEDSCTFLSDGNAETFDTLIGTAGGLKLGLLTVCEKGRLGYNEPSAQFDTVTRSYRLTESIRRELDTAYPDNGITAENVLTMGIRTLCGMRFATVAAYGTEKADAVYRMLYGRDDSTVPAAFLQLLWDVQVFLDEGSASLLGKDRLIV